MRHCIGLAALVMALCLSANSRSASGQPAAELGSPDFKPTAERPVGWRGDWTGQYPGATPPTEWSRRVKGATTELKYQADKPAGADAGKGASALEYFTIKEWLVAGPFAADDPAKDIDKDFLGGEAEVTPAKDAKAGDSAWKALRADVATQSFHECNGGTAVNTNVDFVYAFGKFNSDGGKTTVDGDFANKVAYAHTYIYSPAEVKVQLQLPFAGTAAKFWLNGKPTNLDAKGRTRVDVTLAKGWNRLLVKVSAAIGLGKSGSSLNSRWFVAAYIVPSGPVSYETKNVAWMTKMSGRSMSQPIIVGDKIFVGSGISDLMCIDKKTGKVLWLRSNSPCDALTADEKAGIAGYKDKIEPLAAKVSQANDELVTAINASVSPTGMSSAQVGDVDAKSKAKIAAERVLLDALAEADKAKYPQLYLNEVASSNAVPVSDGKFVYWVCGGSQYTKFPFMIVCFDLDGKRVWTRYDVSMKGGEHGNHISPALVEGKLIYGCGMMRVAYDAKTGLDAWRSTIPPQDWTNAVRSPVVAKVGGENVIIIHNSLHRVSDGSVVGKSNASTIFTDQTLIVQDDVVYTYGVFQGHGKPPSFIASKLEAGPKSQILWAPDGKDVWPPVRHNTIAESYSVASPLYVDGLIYFVDMSGALTILDVAAKTRVHSQWLDGYNRYDRYVYGVVASPTVAGKDKSKSIYIIDDAGYTHILQPGKDAKETGRNVLENIHVSGVGGNPCKQESFYTNPWFEGKFMYLRGEEYLYCIGGQ